MMNKLLVIGIIAIVVVAGFMFLMPEAEGNDEIGATATVYVQSVNGGEIMEAEIDISKLSMTEQMMLSISDEVRTADFTGSISALSWGGSYNVWAVTKVKVTATDDIASLTKIRCSWGGKPGVAGGSINVAPDHATNTASTAALVSVGGDVGPAVENTNAAFGTEYSFDQSSVSNGKFSMWKVYDSSSSRYVFTNLYGDTIDGATITCSVSAYAVDDSGANIGITQTATLKISVNSWSQSGLSIAITGMTAGTAAV